MPNEIKKHVREFVHKYLDVTAEQEHTIVDYALDTWQALPKQVKYLQFVGGIGLGKTRALKIMEYICCNPIVARGTSSPLSVAMMIHQSPPATLILDEADIFPEQEPDEDGYASPNLFDTILHVRARRETSIIVNAGKAMNVFGYTVLATRKQYKDPTIASKCISIRLKDWSRSKENPEHPSRSRRYIHNADIERIGELLKNYFDDVVTHEEYVTG